MKSDSMNNLWVKTRQGLVLVEDAAAVLADNSVIDISALATKAQMLGGCPRIDCPAAKTAN